MYDPTVFDWRPQFNDLYKMATYIIDTWNGSTESNDVVILAGDIGTYCTQTLDALKQLNGIKILVVGNHDIIWGRHLYDTGLFAGVHDAITSQNVFVQHIPTKLVGNEGKYFVHGHHHRYDMPGMQKSLMSYIADTYRLNCAADLIGFKPRTLQDLILQKELLIDKYREMNIIGGN